mgnify:CR=1 FL=1
MNKRIAKSKRNVLQSSAICDSLLNMRKLLEERFWEKVNKTETCWLWTASVGSHGYGVIGIGKRCEGTACSHRYSYELNCGPIPPDMQVLHKCDNRRCVNPSHLFLGTQDDNIKDCISKRRLAVGVRHGRARLTESDIISIRSDTRRPEVIGLEYGVSLSHVNSIKRRTFWSHIA